MLCFDFQLYRENRLLLLLDYYYLISHRESKVCSGNVRTLCQILYCNEYKFVNALRLGKLKYNSGSF